MSTSGFEDFWKAYPRRVAKGAARKAWEKAARSEPDLLALCLSALEWQRTSEQWTRDGGQYVPYASTYLNQERWADEKPLTEGEQRELEQYRAWQSAHAGDPNAALVDFESFRRYQRGIRRAG